MRAFKNFSAAANPCWAKPNFGLTIWFVPAVEQTICPEEGKPSERPVTLSYGGFLSKLAKVLVFLKRH